MYQTELRKPSATVYCLDYSGSMAGEREKTLKKCNVFFIKPGGG